MKMSEYKILQEGEKIKSGNLQDDLTCNDRCKNNAKPECTEKCAYKLTPEVEYDARQSGKMLSLCERIYKIEKENR